jgi:P27 family predicted phage terminase small subunit
MGKRGPRRKLVAFEILDGRPGKRPLPPPGVEALGRPFIPEHLSDDARRCIEVITASMPDGVYSALDTFLLSAFAVAWEIHKKAAQQIAKPDFAWIVSNARGTLRHSPWISLLNHQASTMASLGDRLGLDPKSRANLHLPEQGSRPSRFAGLLGGVGGRPSTVRLDS